MSTTDVERLRSIKTFPSLVKYLRDELDWPIELDHFDDLDPITFDYEPEELGIDSKIAVKIKQIKRLRRLCPNQPWGVFFVNFVPKRLPVTVLRRILQQLVPRKRASASRASQQTWQPNDLLFVSAYGEDEQRQISFAHFAENKEMGDLPVLKVLGWDKDDTAFHLADAHEALKAKLKWPGDEDDIKTWRETWSSAFVLRHREVVDTSKKLAIELADLATNIRRRVNQVLVVEDPEKGPMRKLMAGFKEALIHDLSEDDFADMYAQTIAYGLLAAAISRHVPGEGVALIADNIADMIPVTNPFLKELLGTFLTVGGRKKKLDFDELGINDIIDLLRNANLTAVLHDFGNQNPLEDPVIHFYELFLTEYDAEKRTQRGVFYTPKPVVSFIVRSVHEILKNDFNLKFGLADTTTWAEMAQHQKDLKIPKGVKPDEPFVQILDPATGTGTFLVETIDIIYKTMIKKWEDEGHMPLEYSKLWNNYVPSHLLPRLNGFELLMAPYTIAHMKIGLKLQGTGYRFQAKERARIYLTNTLEEPKDISEYFEQYAPALAHEAQSANKVKFGTPATVIIGNPPYAKFSSNMIPWISNLIEDFKYVDSVHFNEKKHWLHDDYVKFFRFAYYLLDRTDCGCVGMITNRGYISNPTFRGMRYFMKNNSSFIQVLDLHGGALQEETKPPSEIKDKNVFDIKQGVAITVLCKKINQNRKKNLYSQLWGERLFKYNFLLKEQLPLSDSQEVPSQPPRYDFIPKSSESNDKIYSSFVSINEIFSKRETGIQTSRDSFVTDFSQFSLLRRVEDFKSPSNSDEEIRKRYFSGKGSSKYKDGDTRGWKVPEARKRVQADKIWKERIEVCLYRPFDCRFLYYTPWMVDWPRPEVMPHMLKPNIALVIPRNYQGGEFNAVFSSKYITEVKLAESSRGSYCFPLYLYDTSKLFKPDKAKRKPNINQTIIRNLEDRFNLSFIPDGEGDLNNDVGSENLFYYIYSVLHSPFYRKTYSEFIKTDFPRIPITNNINLFRELSEMGSHLIGLHLMESDTLKNHITTFPVSSENAVKKVGEKGKTLADVEKGKGKLYINKTQYFDNLPEEVWNFHIGGYQVCHKWLADRKKAKRTLSAEDIEHYHKIVVALNDTIKIMKQIDETIDVHGGWPIK